MSILSSISDNLTLPSPLTPLITDWTSSSQISLFIKRDELIHPHVSGNKWRKLKHSIIQMGSHGKKGIVTFGGAYSNHLVAVAAAGFLGEFASIGIVRSYTDHPDNHTLRICQKYGMELHFIHPKEYRQFENSRDIRKILQAYPEYVIVPEGGTSIYSLQGVKELYTEIVNALSNEPDYMITSVGSGGTLAGLVNASSATTSTIGLAPFKGKFDSFSGLDFIKPNRGEYLVMNSGLPDVRFGGYDISLINYAQNFYLNTGIRLDPIYTTRAMMKLEELCNSGFFDKHKSIDFLHTGGLQGIEGFNQRHAHKGLQLNYH